MVYFTSCIIHVQYILTLYICKKNWSYNNTYICRYADTSTHISSYIKEGQGEKRYISLLRNLGTEQKCVVNFTPWPLFP
jgi:hypothetical protein